MHGNGRTGALGEGSRDLLSVGVIADISGVEGLDDAADRRAERAVNEVISIILCFIFAVIGCRTAYFAR